MPMSGPAYMHASIATSGLTANQHTGNGRDNLRIVERPDAHIIFPSWCSSEYSLSRLTQHVNYTQVQNFDTNQEHNQRQWTNETLLYKNISPLFYSRKGHKFVVILRDRWRDTYSERGLLLAPNLLPGARGCQRLQPLESRIVRDDLTPLISRISLARLNGLSKSDRVVLISRGLLRATHLLDRLIPTYCHPPFY